MCVCVCVYVCLSVCVCARGRTGLLEEVKSNPLKSSLIGGKGLTEGPWKLAPHGGAIVVTNSADPTRELHLLEEGFVYANKAADEGIRVDSSGSPTYMPLPEAQTIVATLAS